MLIDRKHMHNVQRNLKILIKRNTTRVAATITALRKQECMGLTRYAYWNEKQIIWLNFQITSGCLALNYTVSTYDPH